MGDVLTQNQIDALLSSVQTMGLEHVDQADSGSKTKFRKYDFHTPKKFTKDRLRLLNSVYENYARVVSSYLTSMLRMTCEIELVEVEEQRYYEFNNALSEQDIVAVIGMEIEGEPQDEPVMFQMSQTVIFSMLDRMLGGTGDILDGDSESNSSNNYTDIELALYANVLQFITPMMSDVWQNYLNIRFTYQKIETNPRLTQSVGIDEIVVIVAFEIRLKSVEGRLTFSIPGTALERIFNQFEQLNSTQNRRKEHQTLEEKEEIVRGIENSLLEITAKFNESIISLEDLYSIRVGDVLNLNIEKGSDIQVCVEGKPWFGGRLGVLKDHVAVKISGTVEEAE